MPSSIAAPYNPAFTNPSEDENTVGFGRGSRQLFTPPRSQRVGASPRTSLQRTRPEAPPRMLPSAATPRAIAPTFGEQNAAANEGRYDLATNENARSNAGIFAPGSFGEQNALANTASTVRGLPKPAPLPLPNGIVAARSLANDPSVVRDTGTALGVRPTTGLSRVPPAPQQTERVNPLVGDVNAQPEDTTRTVAPAQSAGAALGFSSRGSKTPAGTDAAPGPNTGGSGLYSRVFSNSRAASVYDGYVRTLFGDD